MDNCARRFLESTQFVVCPPAATSPPATACAAHQPSNLEFSPRAPVTLCSLSRASLCHSFERVRFSCLQVKYFQAKANTSQHNEF